MVCRVADLGGMPDIYWVNGGEPRLPRPSLTLAEMGGRCCKGVQAPQLGSATHNPVKEYCTG